MNSGLKWRAVAVAAALAMAVANLGAAVTDLGPWYQALKQPSWKPPDWVFGPGWTLIFGCTALSGYYAWQVVTTPAERMRVFGLFAVNAVLNVLWSLFFFRLQRPDWALFEVLWLWLSILVLMWALWPYSRRAAWLLLPYLLWVAFAATLNLAVVQLNPHIGASA